MSSFPYFLSFIQLIIIFIESINCTTFTFINKCDATIWPAILTTGANHTQLNPTGFQLQPTRTLSIPAPPGWSGRLWARTGCTTRPSNQFSCSTADCKTNRIECGGSGPTPPATVAEFSLSGLATEDVYDVSLVDGFNLPVTIQPGLSGCASAGCSVDLTGKCPSELRVGANGACRSGCDVFGKPEYCCSGAFAGPDTCRPTYYSQVFKQACPDTYCYPYDDMTGRFSCGGGDYNITFCPYSTARHKKAAAPDSGDIKHIPPVAAAASVCLTVHVYFLFSVCAGIQIIFQNL